MAHILGLLAVITFLLSFQFKRRKNIIIVNVISRLLYILQYIFLGAFEGAALDFLGFLFSIPSGFKENKFIKKHIKILIILINIILISTGLLLYENIFSMFAIAGIVFEIMALWLSKEKNIRILSLLAAPFWLTYNFANAAYSSAFGNVFSIISIVIAMVRLDFNKNK